MSDVREVTEWHEAMDGSLKVAVEQLNDAAKVLIDATGLPKALIRFVLFFTQFTGMSTNMISRWKADARG